MAIHVLSSSKRARSIPSLVAHNQCGGPKKAGIAGFQGMGPRDGWRGGRGASHPLNYFFKKCSDIPRSMMTMNPVGSGGVGRPTRLTKMTFHGNGL
jgi:hypothetical protein|tara:strand:- start:892 stop:1179 length:288 start_codon:yes stop_codon:yes gene_type:complete